MVRPIGTRRFVYDAGGRVMGEYGASASDVWAEFIWAEPQIANGTSPYGGGDGLGGYAPLAVATPDLGGTVELIWVHGNHLGVPMTKISCAGCSFSTVVEFFVPRTNV